MSTASPPWSYVANNNIPAVVQALNSGQLTPNSLDQFNNTILANAAARGYLDMAMMLVEKGAKIPDPNACTWVGKQAVNVSANDIAKLRAMVCQGQIDNPNKKYLLIGGGVLALLVAGGLAYYYFKGRK